MRIFSTRLSLIVASLVLTACAGSAQLHSDPAQSAPPSATSVLTPDACVVNTTLSVRRAAIITATQTVELEVEMATTPEQRRRGLMGRTSLAAECGMLFVYDQDAEGGFWMKNTLIPLDIAYLDANAVIISIKHMTPCLNDPCREYDPGQPYHYALEVGAGSFAQWGVNIGDPVKLLP